jgi:O-antigen/teichoic acid export membrane protein
MPQFRQLLAVLSLCYKPHDLSKVQDYTYFMTLLKRITQKLTGKDTGDIYKNMAILATGSGIAKLIGFAAMPIITRLYSPEDFGVFALFVALTMVFTTIGSLRYSMAVPLPRHDALAFNLFCVSLCLVTLIASAMALILLFFGDTLLPLISAEALQPYWWLLGLALFGGGLSETLNQWATRKRRFKVAAKNEVTKTCLSAGTKIGFGLLGLKPVGLLAGQVAMQWGGIIALSRAFWPDFKAQWPRVELQRFWFLIRFYRSFPFYRLPSQFLMALNMQLPVLMTSKLFTLTATGQLSLAITTIAIPMQLFGRTLGRAYYGEISSIGRKDINKLYSLSLSVLKRLALLAILPTLVLAFFGPWLFSLVFGTDGNRQACWPAIFLFRCFSSFYLRQSCRC